MRVGAQCQSPYVGGATVEPGPDGGTYSAVYGTSCAPCDGEDDVARVDERGCPIYVTLESCGGEVCLFGEPISIVEPEDDAGASDGGSDGDAGE